MEDDLKSKLLPAKNNGNGFDCSTHRWIQTFGEVEVTIPLNSYGAITMNDMVCHVEPAFLRVGIKDHSPILCGPLHGRIKAEKTVCVLANNMIKVNLIKAIRMQKWEKLMSSDPEFLSSDPETECEIQDQDQASKVSFNDIKLPVKESTPEPKPLKALPIIEEKVYNRKIAQMKRLHIKYTPWKPGCPIPSKCKQLIANVYHQIAHQNPDKKDIEILKIAADLLGVGTYSISRLKAEYKRHGKPSTPGKKRPSRIGRHTRKERYDEYTMCAIRRIVHNLFRQNEVPTVSKVNKIINDDSELPNFGERTTYRLLHDLNFAFVNKKRRNVLIDKDEIIEWRRKFLRQMRLYRNENRNIVYLDETWVDEGHSVERHDVDQAVACQKDALKAAQKTPKGKGSKLIILHAGGAVGFVSGCLCVCHTKTKGDCHDDMNAPFFEKWFKSSLLPQLPTNSVIVLDAASCHTVKNPFPTKTWLKAQIQSWLTEHGVAWEEDMIKQELLALAEPLRGTCDEYVLDVLAREAGHAVVRLPPYHYELNPVELIWTSIKDYITRHSTTFSIENVKALASEAFEEVSSSLWPKYVEHVVEVEHEMWELDGLMEDMMESIFSNSDSSSASSEEEEEEEDDDDGKELKAIDDALLDAPLDGDQWSIYDHL